MAKCDIFVGSTSQTRDIYIQNSSLTNGGGLTGLAYNTSGLTAYYSLPQSASVAITLATLSAVTSAWSSGGFKEIDSVNMPGWYRFDIPNAALASGSFVAIHFRGATNMADCPLEVNLTAVNNQSAASYITGINGLAPPTNWNLQSIDASGRVDIGKILGTASAGAAGSVGIDWAHVANPTTALVLSGTTVGTITTYTGNTLQTGDAYARLGAPAGASVSADVASVKSDTGTILTDVNTGAGAIYTRLGAPAGASIAADIANVKPSILTTALTESYAANGAAPTLAQLAFMNWSAASENSTTGTVLTSYKLDGVTAAMTFTLNSATAPTSIVRAT